jgi:hypothetical protein
MSKDCPREIIDVSKITDEAFAQLTPDQMKKIIVDGIRERLKHVVSTRTTGQTSREQLESVLRGYGDGCEHPPRYEIESWEPSGHVVNITIRDNRPGPDSLVLKMLEDQGRKTEITE